MWMQDISKSVNDIWHNLKRGWYSYVYWDDVTSTGTLFAKEVLPEIIALCCGYTQRSIDKSNPQAKWTNWQLTVYIFKWYLITRAISVCLSNKLLPCCERRRFCVLYSGCYGVVIPRSARSAASGYMYTADNQSNIQFHSSSLSGNA